MRKTPLQRLQADKDFAVIQTIIYYLRAKSPALVPTDEISNVIGRTKSQTYGLIKKGREYLDIVSGDFIVNESKRKHKAMFGYTATTELRAAEYEANKSFMRGAGHLAQGIKTHARVPRMKMVTPEDLELWLATRNRARAAALFLEASEDSKVITARRSNNSRIDNAAASETVTPWETLGLENHQASDDDDDDDGLP